MHGVAGQEHAAVLIVVGDQQVLPPGIAGQHFVFHRHADDLLELPLHLLVVSTVACSVQCLVESCMIRKPAVSSAT